VQAAAVPPSSWHWKLLPVLELVNEKLADVEFVGFTGCAVKVTVGATVSTVQLELTGAPVPAPFVASTWKVCAPLASAVYVRGLVHALNVPPSRAQENVALGSLEVNVNVALVWFVGVVGEDVIEAVGAVTIDHGYDVAGPVTPAESIARTWNVWEPSARPAYVCGLVQAAYAAPSSAHWKLATVVSAELNVNVAPVEPVEVPGPEVIVVEGAAFVVNDQPYGFAIGVPSAAWTPVVTVPVYTVDEASRDDGVSVAVFVVPLNVTVAGTVAPDGSLSRMLEEVIVAGLTAPENVTWTAVFASTPEALVAGAVDVTVSGAAAPFGVTERSTK
jgi:hypothetical protein